MWTRRIEGNFEFLVDKLSFEDVKRIICGLIIKDVFSTDDQDFVEKGSPDHTPSACNRRFLQCLLKKDRGTDVACSTFIQVLKEEGYTHIVEELEKESQRLDSAQAGAADYPLQDEAEGLTYNQGTRQGGLQPVYIGRVDHLVLTNTTSVMGTDDQDMEASQTESLLNCLDELLTRTPGREEALHTLEERLCEKLRKNSKEHLGSFKDFMGKPFRQFLKDTHPRFKMTRHGNDIMVSRYTSESPEEEAVPSGSMDSRSGNENPATNDDKDEWEEVLSKKEKKMKKKQVKQSAQKDMEQTKSKDSSMIESFLQRSPGRTLIFRPCEYKKGHAAQFTKDVVSLWNTPNRNRSFIILGIESRSASPHNIVGLKTPASKAYYYALFLSQLFELRPKFIYKEVFYLNKRIGMIQVEKSAGFRFPSVVSSEQKSPDLRKNQLWIRHGDQNATVELSNMTELAQINDWFKKPSSQQSVAVSNKFATRDSDSAPPAKAVCKKKVTVAQPTCSENDKPDQVVETSKFMESLTHFKKGHFVLLCGSLPKICTHLDALANPPFICVYDVDVNGRDSGLLNCLESSIKKKRNLSVSTWKDAHTGVTERSTQWWSLRGRSELADSDLSGLTGPKWYKQVLDKIEKICVMLQRFCEDYTLLTILVLWPSQEIEATCIQKFLSKLQEYEIKPEPSVVLWFTDEAQDSGTREVKNIEADFERSVKIFRHGLEDFCQELKYSLEVSNTGDFQYEVPAQDVKSVQVTQEEAAWLKQDCEVLYIDHPYTDTSKKMTADDLRAEGDHFFRGGSISWFTRYDMQSNCFDVVRSISRKIQEHIQTVYIEGFKSGTVYLYHAPGSGGSTMAQRILFDLHKTVPCVHLKLRTGSSVEEIGEKLVFMCERTALPVLVLLDGEDEQKFRNLLTQVRRNTIIFLYLKRFPYHINESRVSKESESKFYLQGFVTDQESRNLLVQFEPRCEGNKKKLKGLKKLDQDVQKSKKNHQMFEYGLTVYDNEFHGVIAYVRGYLQINPNQNIGLWSWQKCLGYLALVYHYGQSSMPCQFIGSLMGKPDTLDIEDLPDPVAMLVVPDENEGKSQHVRIMHFAIATEILEQVLSNSSSRTFSNAKLSKEATRNLKDFCIDFLDQMVKNDAGSSTAGQTVSYILTKTFIFRDNSDVIDVEPQAKKAPARFSQIMMDLDSQVPFNGRYDVLKKLCQTFPENPNFKAHLGRFLAICRPEEEEEAEKYFKEAIRLGRDKDRKGYPNSDESYDLDLMHIFHMYGCFFQRKINRKTSEAEVMNLSENSSTMQKVISDVISDVDQASENFQQCRQYSPATYREAYQYLNEIDTRLQACRFLDRVFPGGIGEVLKSWRDHGTCYRFVKICITEIEDLVMECYHCLTLLENLQSRIQQFNHLFKKHVDELQMLDDTSDPVHLLRLQLTTSKLKINHSDSVVGLENQKLSPDMIENIIRILEDIFEYENVNRDLVKSKLDLDYRDWIRAIRNPNFRKDYSIEQVLEHVHHWQDSVHSPVSTFYLFVLQSLLGFGTSNKRGNEECLQGAKELREKMQCLWKTETKARFPLEWLGKETSPGIRRLVSINNISLKNRTLTDASSDNLCTCKGTIMPKPLRQTGHIALDTGLKTPVMVFFVPGRADLTGSRFKGTRVQFHLGFTLFGYEAYDVTVLKKYPCPQCTLKMEITTKQTSVPCKNCGAEVVRREEMGVVD